MFYTHIENVFGWTSLLFYIEKIILLLLIYLIPVKLFMKDRMTSRLLFFISGAVGILFFLFSLFTKQYYNSQIVIGYAVFLCLFLFFSIYNFSVLERDMGVQFFLIVLTLFLHIWLYVIQFLFLVVIAHFGSKFVAVLDIGLLSSLLFSTALSKIKVDLELQPLIKKVLLLLALYFLVFTATIGIFIMISGLIDGQLRIVLYDHFPMKALMVKIMPEAVFIYEDVFGFAYLAIVYLVIILLPLLFLLRLLINEEKSKKKLLEQEIIRKDLYFYIDYVETFNMDLRKIQHDYSNILLGFGGFIYNEPMKIEALKSYYQKVMSEFENVTPSLIQVSNLKNIKNVEIAGLLISKLMRAHERKIKISIEIKETIVVDQVNTLDLARIFGIMIDNALEGAFECEEPYVQIALINMTQGTVVFHVTNNTIGEDLVLKMKERSFSSKGEGRGLGLEIVREIVEKDAGLSFDFSQEGSCVSQVLTVIQDRRD
ncbi:sensor histidine kinase [Enterococcus sp. AZ192]|uniref:sensor histidine kinase n=1 Tax=unclassified Enterococcus TaxID=2608891 RepID=UPI003D2A038B